MVSPFKNVVLLKYTYGIGTVPTSRIGLRLLTYSILESVVSMQAAHVATNNSQDYHFDLNNHGGQDIPLASVGHARVIT